MQSKWIEELFKEIAYEYNYDKRPQKSVQIIKKADTLLRQAMNEIDNEILYDKIERFIHGH